MIHKCLKKRDQNIWNKWCSCISKCIQTSPSLDHPSVMICLEITISVGRTRQLCAYSENGYWYYVLQEIVIWMMPNVNPTQRFIQLNQYSRKIAAFQVTKPYRLTDKRVMREIDNGTLNTYLSLHHNPQCFGKN